MGERIGAGAAGRMGTELGHRRVLELGCMLQEPEGMRWELDRKVVETGRILVELERRAVRRLVEELRSLVGCN